jgi:hypothetical protein
VQFSDSRIQRFTPEKRPIPHGLTSSRWCEGFVRQPPKITLELYAQTVSADQQEAHKKVVQMVLPSEFSQKLKARSVTATA